MSADGAAAATGATGAAAMTDGATAASIVGASMAAVVVVVDEAVTVSGLVIWPALETEVRAPVEATVVDGRFSAKTASKTGNVSVGC